MGSLSYLYPVCLRLHANVTCYVYQRYDVLVMAIAKTKPRYKRNTITEKRVHKQTHFLVFPTFHGLII